MPVFNPALMAKLPRSYLEEDIGSRLIVTAIVFLVLQTIAVTLFYISRYITKTLNGYDCWLLMPLGYTCSTGLCILGLLTVRYGGVGRHVEAVLLQDPTGHRLQTRSKIDKGVEFLDFAALSGSKLVILSLYMRIFNTNRRYRIATYAVGILILLNWLAVILASATICQPFSAYWNHHIHGSRCGNIITIWRFVSVPNIATDLMMLVLPLPAIYKLHVNTSTKIGLFATFMVGSMGMITSILRMVTFLHAEGFFQDPTYKCVPTMIYTIAEASTYLIASCMPALRPLHRHFFGEHSLTRAVGKLLPKKDKVQSRSQKFECESSERVIQLRVMYKGASQSGDFKSLTSHKENDGFTRLHDKAECV